MTKKTMTEKKWAVCADPLKMLKFLGEEISERKERLFAVACCRRVSDYLDERCEQALKVAESYADGLVDDTELCDSHLEAHEFAGESEHENEDYSGAYAGKAVAHACDSPLCVYMVIDRVAEVMGETLWEFDEIHEKIGEVKAAETTSDPEEEAAFTVYKAMHKVAVQRESAVQCGLLRCIFGNPFWPLQARAFPAHILGLAEACYADFPSVSQQVLILADALEDLGEESAAAHCREPNHVKGCHVLDWILKKE